VSKLKEALEHRIKFLHMHDTAITSTLVLSEKVILLSSTLKVM